jgi:competence protein ComEC
MSFYVINNVKSLIYRGNMMLKMLKKRKIKLFLVVLVFCLVLNTLFSRLIEEKRASNLNTVAPEDIVVHFIDIGQGDSIFIKSANTTILIDGGDVNYGDYLNQYLSNMDINYIDLVIATHPHSDHIGGLIEIINNFDVKGIMTTGAIHSTNVFESFMTAIETKGLSIFTSKAHSNVAVGDIDIKVIAPVSEDYTNLNNSSIVLKLEWGDTSFLFTGDIEAEAENSILNSAQDLKADVLKVAHHGSKTSSTVEFLEAVSPTIAVISTGIYNSYGHPDDEVLYRLKSLGAEVYRTDIDGTIIIKSNGEKLEIIEGDK